MEIIQDIFREEFLIAIRYSYPGLLSYIAILDSDRGYITIRIVMREAFKKHFEYKLAVHGVIISIQCCRYLNAIKIIF